MAELAKRFEKHIAVENQAVNAVDLLASETTLSKQQIKQVMQKGAVWQTKGKQTQRVRRAKKLIAAGTTLHIYYDKTVLERVPPEPILLSDEGQYSVWNKPYGMLSQGSKWGDHCTITRWAEQHLSPQRNSFTVHRLDRAANGIIVVAHEKKAAAALSALFQQREISKRYQIWVPGDFSLSHHDSRVTVDQQIDGRTAISHFDFVRYEVDQERSLIDVEIETGRKHQIRRHSAYLGFPVIGDRLYGNAQSQQDLQLKAYYLAFQCPFSLQKKVFDLNKKD